MAFKDFEKAIQEQQTKMVRFAPQDIVETLTLKTSDPMYMATGETIEFTLGKVFRLVINDSTYSELRPLKPYYVQHKTELENALKIITRKVAMVMEQKDALVAVMAESIIPEAVMARMRGENPGTDNESLLELMTQKLGKELVRGSAGFLVNRKSNSDFYLKSIAGRVFRWRKRDRDISVTWGNIHCEGTTTNAFVNNNSSLEDQIFFIANIELIKLRLTRFLDDLVLLQKNHLAVEGE